MNSMMTKTIDDLRGGRQTWRVLLILLVPAFATGLGLGIIRAL